MDDLYPQVRADNSPDLSAFNDLWMEIGFGAAGHLVDLAVKNPDTAIFGAEPFLNGVGKALAGIEEHNLKNLFLHHGDARDIMDTLPDGALGRLYVLFPDPWPKTRHNKRRIINEDFLKDVYRVLKPGGTLYFASDIIDYVDWTMARLRKNGNFQFDFDKPGSWRTPYEGWPGTKYEAKAFREGRSCHYLKFKRAA